MKKPEKIRASTGFEPVTSAMPVRWSTMQLSYEATPWERCVGFFVFNFKVAFGRCFIENILQNNSQGHWEVKIIAIAVEGT